MPAKLASKKKPGRKSKYTPQVTEKIFEALQCGCTRRAACASAGIGESTLNDWLNAYPEFSAACTRAEDLAEVGYTKVIQECSVNGDWKAAAWWLERRRKEEFSSRAELTGKDGGAIQVEAINQLSDDELNRKISELLVKAGTGIPVPIEAGTTETGK